MVSIRFFYDVIPVSHDFTMGRMARQTCSFFYYAIPVFHDFTIGRMVRQAVPN